MSLGYENVIVSGSMSKAYSLSGIRVGWLASPSIDLVRACEAWRAYTMLSVSQVDQAIALYALGEGCLHNLLRRNNDLARQNLGILERFVEQHRWACDWVKPVGGSVAFVRFSRMGRPVDDGEFCEKLLEREGVLVAPGRLCFGNGEDFRGYVRIGYVIETEALERALEGLRAFMKDGFEAVAVNACKQPCWLSEHSTQLPLGYNYNRPEDCKLVASWLELAALVMKQRADNICRGDSVPPVSNKRVDLGLEEQLFGGPPQEISVMKTRKRPQRAASARPAKRSRRR
ncbi:hypothetical protein ACJ72_07719 [Emergomyces africanus]|uniref:Aminotransferase class I/classII large domain-containing protein n=1 Tax=Emergomyces africanus TaxID=1955775 RepID=A0A1B7NMY1_9EURO|nr:hypothetical protein ACJ72_07719 [Emergomyces africanus]